MVTYFKYENHKSKKKYKKYKTLTTILRTFETIVIIATSSSSLTLSVTGIGSTDKPISSTRACGLSIRNTVIYEIVLQKYYQYKKQYQNINKQMTLLIKNV